MGQTIWAMWAKSREKINRKKKKLATCLIGMVKGTSACELKVLHFVKKKKAKKEYKTNTNTRN